MLLGDAEMKMPTDTLIIISIIYASLNRSAFVFRLLILEITFVCCILYTCVFKALM